MSLLRRFSVRQRIASSFGVLLLALIGTLPLLIWVQADLLARQHQFVERTGRADRLVSQAATAIASSRANVLRYLLDFTPSVSEALTEVDTAVQALTDASSLFDDTVLVAQVQSLIESLTAYRAQIVEVQKVRQAGDVQQLARLQFAVLRQGADSTLTAQTILERSQKNTAEAYSQLDTAVRQRQMVVTLVYGGIILVAFWLSWEVQHSITEPIAELGAGAEALIQGHLEQTVPVRGQDELSVLAQTFNRLAGQLRQSYRELEQRVAERTLELEQRAKELEAASRVAREATAFRDVDELLTSAVTLIASAFGYEHVAVYLVDEQERHLVLKAASSEAGKALVQAGFRQAVGEGVVGSAARTRLPRLVEDVQADPAYFALPGLGEVRSELAIPMRMGERVIGVFDLESSRARAFTAASVTVLQTLADQITLALENARLLAASQQAIAELQRLYSTQAREAWTQLVGGTIPAYRYTGVDVIPVRDMPKRGPEGHRLEIPLKLREQVLGTIILERPLSQPDWTQDERLIAEAIAEQAALALDNARLLAETRTRAARESLTAEIAARMRESLDIEKVLQVAVQDLGRALGAVEVNIQLVEQEE